MRRRLLIAIALSIALPAMGAGRDAALRAAVSAKRAPSLLLAGKPTAPAPAPRSDEKPRAGWSGFYGGLNGGAVAPVRE